MALRKPDNRAGMHRHELETPILMIDLDLMEGNLQKMARFFGTRPAALRPHVKTHRTPALAHKQIAAGAIGICCGSLDEAEVMIESGIGDVLVTREIVQPQAIQRVAALAEHSDIKIIVDSEDGAVRVSAAAAPRAARVQTLVDVMVQLPRSGVEPGEPARALARKIHELPGLEFAGLVGYEGSMHGWETHKREATCREALGRLIKTKVLIERDGIPVPIVSAGATSTHRVTGATPGVTEVQAGSYLTMDAEYYSWYPEFEITLGVLTTVISRPRPTAVTTDVGSKKLTQDAGLPVAKESASLKLVALNEHHGLLEIIGDRRRVQVGDKLEIVPSHGCTTFNLYDEVYAMRGDRCEAIWEVAARGT
jgi:D-serine deaminase-like pyridoxal phosphate-dependent protein